MQLIDKLANQLNSKVPNFKTSTFEDVHEIGIWVFPDLSVDTSRIWFNNVLTTGPETIQVDRKNKILEKVMSVTFSELPESFRNIPALKKSSNLKTLLQTNSNTPLEVRYVKDNSEWVYKSKNRKDVKRKYKIAIKQEYRDVWDLYKPYSINVHYNNKSIEGYYCTYNTLSKRGYNIIKQLFEK